MANFEVLSLDPTTPQILAPGAGDGYSVPRDMTFATGTTLNAPTTVVSVNTSTDALRITQVGSGNALLVEDSANPDATPTVIDALGKLGIGTTSPQTFLHIAATNSGSTSDTPEATIRLEDTDASVAADQPIGKIEFYANDVTTPTIGVASYILAKSAASNGGANLMFATAAAGSLASERMRISSAGNVGIGTTSPNIGSLTGTVLTLNGAVQSNLEMASAGASRARIASSSTDTTFETRVSAPLVFGTNSTERMRLDASGNLGLGVTPSAWGTLKAFQINTQASLSADGTSVQLSTNAYFDGSNWKYIQTDEATNYYQLSGAHVWRTAPSGTAGNAISFTQALTLDANRNLLLNGTTAPASGVGTFAIFNGTAPTGSVTNGCVLYTEDVSSSSELKVRDEAGNVTTLSPHNFSLIPEGASEDMAWAYYSEKGGKRINVDMLKLARMVEKLTGEKLVYEA